MSNSIQFVGTFALKGLITTETGLHIGGSKTKMEIGGVDNPVLRDPSDNLPYIAGSSLKGKMRALLSYLHGEASVDLEKGTDLKAHLLPNIFGTSADTVAEVPTRLIIRDAYPTSDTVEKWNNLDSELLYTEYKAENTVNRITAKANPRFMERVVKGSKFNFELLFMMFKGQSTFYKSYKNDLDYVKHIFEGLRMIEANYLGGSGTRGYGKVSFQCLKPTFISSNDYQTGADNYNYLNQSIDESSLFSVSNAATIWEKKNLII